MERFKVEFNAQTKIQILAVKLKALQEKAEKEHRDVDLQ